MGFNKKSKVIRFMEGPIKILARALDSYVRNMSSSGAHVYYGSAISCPTPQLGSLPRNIGVSSSNSGYSTIASSDVYFRRSRPMSRQDVAKPALLSLSDPIGQIDEYKCCEFRVDHVPEVVHPKGLRSAATRRSRKIASVDDDFTMNVEYKKI